MGTQHIVLSLKKYGLRNLNPIQVNPDVIKEIQLKTKEILYGFKILSTAEVVFSKTSDMLNIMGSIVSQPNTIISMGLVDIRKLYVKSNTAVEIIPIIYKENI